MHTWTASLKSLGMTPVLGYPPKPCWGWGFLWLFLLWEKLWESGEEQGTSGNTSLRWLQRSQRGGFAFVGQSLLSAEGGGIWPRCRRCLAASQPWLAAGLWENVLLPWCYLRTRINGWCVPFPFVTLPRCGSWTGKVLLLLSADAAGRAGEGSILWKCLLHIKTQLIHSNSDLLVLAQAPCHRKERQRSSDRM